MYSAYVVAERNAELLKDPKAAAVFGKEIEEWIKSKVAHHKYLRGGVFIIDIIPKRSVQAVIVFATRGSDVNMLPSVVLGRFFDAN
jgi:hypothetical protein